MRSDSGPTVRQRIFTEKARRTQIIACAIDTLAELGYAQTSFARVAERGGAILLVHAVAMVVLAETTTTTTCLAMSRPISWSITGVGLALLVGWIRRRTS